MNLQNIFRALAVALSLCSVLFAEDGVHFDGPKEFPNYFLSESLRGKSPAELAKLPAPLKAQLEQETTATTRSMEKALGSLFQRMTVPLIAEGDSQPSMQRYLPRLKKEAQAIDPTANVLPSFGVVRSAIGYLYAEVRAGMRQSPPVSAQETLERIARETHDIPGSHIRGVESDWDIMVRTQNKEALAKVAQRITEVTTAAERQYRATEMKGPFKRSLFPIPDVKDYETQVGRSMRQGGSTLDYLSFDPETGRFLIPREHPNIVRDLVRGTYHYVAPTDNASVEDPLKQTVRGLRPSLELPFLAVHDDRRLRQEIQSILSSLSSDKPPTPKELKQAFEQYAKLVRNARFEGGHNRFIRAKPGTLDALFYETSRKLSVLAERQLIPEYVDRFEVGTEARSRNGLSDALFVPMDQFIANYTDKGFLRHGTPDPDNAPAILRQGLFVSSSIQGRALFGRGVYTSPHLETSRGYAGDTGLIFNLEVASEKPLNVLDWEKAETDPVIVSIVKAATASGKDPFAVLAREYGVDIILHGHVLLQNVEAVRFPEGMRGLLESYYDSVKHSTGGVGDRLRLLSHYRRLRAYVGVLEGTQGLPPMVEAKEVLDEALDPRTAKAHARIQERERREYFAGVLKQYLADPSFEAVNTLLNGMHQTLKDSASGGHLYRRSGDGFDYFDDMWTIKGLQRAVLRGLPNGGITEFPQGAAGRLLFTRFSQAGKVLGDPDLADAFEVEDLARLQRELRESLVAIVEMRGERALTDFMNIPRMAEQLGELNAESLEHPTVASFVSRYLAAAQSQHATTQAIALKLAKKMAPGSAPAAEKAMHAVVRRWVSAPRFDSPTDKAFLNSLLETPWGRNRYGSSRESFARHLLAGDSADREAAFRFTSSRDKDLAGDLPKALRDAHVDELIHQLRLPIDRARYQHVLGLMDIDVNGVLGQHTPELYEARHRLVPVLNTLMDSPLPATRLLAAEVFSQEFGKHRSEGREALFASRTFLSLKEKVQAYIDQGAVHPPIAALHAEGLEKEGIEFIVEGMRKRRETTGQSPAAHAGELLALWNEVHREKARVPGAFNERADWDEVRHDIAYRFTVLGDKRLTGTLDEQEARNAWKYQPEIRDLFLLLLEDPSSRFRSLALRHFDTLWRFDPELIDPLCAALERIDGGMDRFISARGDLVPAEEQKRLRELAVHLLLYIRDREPTAAARVEKALGSQGLVREVQRMQREAFEQLKTDKNNFDFYLEKLTKLGRPTRAMERGVLALVAAVEKERRKSVLEKVLRFFETHLPSEPTTYRTLARHLAETNNPILYPKLLESTFRLLKQGPEEDRTIARHLEKFLSTAKPHVREDYLQVARRMGGFPLLEACARKLEVLGQSRGPKESD